MFCCFMVNDTSLWIYVRSLSLGDSFPWQKESQGMKENGLRKKYSKQKQKEEKINSLEF